MQDWGKKFLGLLLCSNYRKCSSKNGSCSCFSSYSFMFIFHFLSLLPPVPSPHLPLSLLFPLVASSSPLLPSSHHHILIIISIPFLFLFILLFSSSSPSKLMEIIGIWILKHLKYTFILFYSLGLLLKIWNPCLELPKFISKELLRRPQFIFYYSKVDFLRTNPVWKHQF